eukprot:snap_masked-scaffold_2-processed-gene-9.36-mRNA-1 protein AED:1.00 eAED:1.00 QI:0/-1/0/0/-1/1/1/0/321
MDRNDDLFNPTSSTQDFYYKRKIARHKNKLIRKPVNHPSVSTINTDMFGSLQDPGSGFSARGVVGNSISPGSTNLDTVDLFSESVAESTESKFTWRDSDETLGRKKKVVDKFPDLRDRTIERDTLFSDPFTPAAQGTKPKFIEIPQRRGITAIVPPIPYCNPNTIDTSNSTLNPYNEVEDTKHSKIRKTIALVLVFSVISLISISVALPFIQGEEEEDFEVPTISPTELDLSDISAAEAQEICNKQDLDIEPGVTLVCVNQFQGFVCEGGTLDINNNGEFLLPCDNQDGEEFCICPVGRIIAQGNICSVEGEDLECLIAEI